MVLHRALNADEIDQGYVIVPKSRSAFLAAPRIDIDSHMPFSFAVSEQNAIRQHQWKQDGFRTRGVSTTPHLNRAIAYAGRHGYIVKIDRQIAGQRQVVEFDVNERLAEHPEDIACQEDDEIILVLDRDGDWPEDIIVGVLTVVAMNPVDEKAPEDSSLGWI
jgi:hypothetical protein